MVCGAKKNFRSPIEEEGHRKISFLENVVIGESLANASVLLGRQ